MAYLSLLFHAITLLLSHATLVIASFSGNHTDYLALLAIKSSITYDPQRVLDTWNNSLHFCQWQSVTCGRRHRRVTILDLGSRGIVGSLAPQIGNLSFLKVIVLKNNTFKGVIPPQVGGLFRLERLVFVNNSFEGEVPVNLSNCTKLNRLDLAGNKLVGTLPQQFSLLAKLKILLLNYNHLIGGIPPSWGNLTSLQVLHIGENNLSGSIPQALARLNNLQVLVFDGNKLYGMMPPSLYNLTSLVVLSFPDNHISGSLPKDIGLQLPNIEVFRIWGNKFIGSIPSSFSNCSKLENLALSENGFTGKIKINFEQIPNIWFVSLFNNSLGTSEPDEMEFIDSLANCSKLELLLAQENQLGGVLPSSVGNLSSQLSVLALFRNFIYGPLPSTIGNLVKLTKLGMSNNQLTGKIPSELGNLQNLVRLDLRDNRFTGNVPASLGNLSSLTEWTLANNQLEGEIPVNLGSCRNLMGFDLSGNKLTGQIPIELFQPWSQIVYIQIFNNHLVGPLPQEIGNLKRVTELDISQNDLVGKIPDTITSCTSLEYLYLEENSFEGPIPPAMSTLRGIQELDLSGNNFSGKIPIFLEQLNLSLLNLSFNNLVGEVPTTGIFKNASAIAVGGNKGLCGGLPELRLPKCVVVARSKKGSRLSRVILVIIPLCTFLVVATTLALLFCRQRKKRQPPPSETSLVEPFSRVSYGSILKATNEFSQQNLIGTGTFSVVYKGILEPFGTMVAIKVLKLANQGALKSFMAECEALKNIRHRNLIKIITSCSSVDFQGNDFKALIYEFMPKGNLDKWLHPSSEQEIGIEEASQQLSLHQRVTVAIDVAHAIHYLHQGCEIPIIHCDLKPSNILLDGDMVAHIGDFGLAKFLPLKPHEVSSMGIRGTIGYAAPEYGLGSEMTKEGDIYSFGILLLEMITGKRPTDPVFQDSLNIHSYVNMAFPGHVMELIEPSLLFVHQEEMKSSYRNRHYREDESRKRNKLEEAMISFCRIGLACSMDSPKERMDTSKIIQELRHINSIIALNWESETKRSHKGVVPKFTGNLFPNQ